VPAKAETLRIATYNVHLARKGPGLLLRDIVQGNDAQVRAVVQVIVAAHPDILLVTEFDWDGTNAALSAMQASLVAAGASFPYSFAARPNRGMRSDVDLDGNGRIGGPGDAQGYGRFNGQYGMAILSRLPIDAGAAQDFSTLLWRDLPGNMLDGAHLSPDAVAVQRLSTTGHWDVPVTLPGGQALHVLAYDATPPVFDGPEDRNGRRNRDETAFWLRYLDNTLPWPAPEAPFAILGDANLDPVDGDGRPDALLALLADARVADPRATSPGGAAAGRADDKGDPALDTTDWAKNRTAARNLRVDYVLPSSDLAIAGAGVFWPLPDDPMAAVVAAASPHRLVWVDIILP